MAFPAVLQHFIFTLQIMLWSLRECKRSPCLLNYKAILWLCCLNWDCLHLFFPRCPGLHVLEQRLGTKILPTNLRTSELPHHWRERASSRIAGRRRPTENSWKIGRRREKKHKFKSQFTILYVSKIIPCLGKEEEKPIINQVRCFLLLLRSRKEKKAFPLATLNSQFSVANNRYSSWSDSAFLT